MANLGAAAAAAAGAAIAAVAGAAAVPGVAAVAAPAFALTPADAVAGIIDYSTTEGRKLYTRAPSRLDEELFDCVPEGLYGFLQSLADIAREYG